MGSSRPTLVFIIGPPAVGKMTVGAELARRTGLKLFHNHQTIDLVLPFFAFGSPPFSRLVGEFRKRILQEEFKGSESLIENSRVRVVDDERLHSKD